MVSNPAPEVKLWRATPGAVVVPKGMAVTRPIVDPAVTGWRRWFRMRLNGLATFCWDVLAEGGAAIGLLYDIESRFAFAERTIQKVPTGIRWSEAVADVDTLRWEAAQQATHLDAVDRELAALRWGDPGTPAAVLAENLREQRGRHVAILEAIQREADALARTAGNAFAASRVALAAHGGNVRALEAAIPSVAAIAAAGRLGGTRARLEALTAAWTSLDPSGQLALAQATQPDRDDD